MTSLSTIRSAVFLLAFAPVSIVAQHGPHSTSHPSPRPRPEKGGGGSGGVSAPNRESETQIERLEKMTPSERSAALDKLPQERREHIEKRLEHLQKLTPEQRAQLQERLNRFKNLSKEQQQQVRHIAQSMQQLPQDRKKAVRQELNTLRTLPQGERDSRLQSSTWQKQFSPQEQEILKQSTDLLPQQP